MPGTIRPTRVNHVNLVLEDFDASVAHVGDVFGGEFLVDLPQDAWHACLVDIGHVIFELFVPHNFLLSTRYGPHHFGIEFQADIDEARAVLDERNIRIIRDLGVAVYTHPADCHGVSLEFFTQSFHADARLTGGPMRPTSYWRDEQPLGLTGLHGLTLVTPALEATAEFFCDLLDARPMAEQERPELSGRSMVLEVADIELEILTPSGPGLVREHLERHGEGLRSTVLGVRDIEQAREHLATLGIELVPGTTPNALAIPAAQNLGVIFEIIPHDG